MNMDLEINFIMRLLKKNVAFSALCVLVISLGIGVSVTMYSVVSDLAFNPLPYKQGDRMVTVKAIDRDSQSMKGIGGIDAYLYSYLRDNSRHYSEFGGFVFSRATLSDGEVAEQYAAADITANLLQITQVSPIMGRSLTSADEVPNAEPVALISEKVWRNYYAANPDIIGRSSRINGKVRTIVGVMPEGFQFPVNHDMWLPLQLTGNPQPGEGPDITPVGVIKPSASLSLATGELQRLARQAAADYPNQYGNRDLSAVSYTRMFVANIMSSVYLLIGATFAVLLLVCMNMGNLLLIRANELSQEMAVRSAMGAGQLAIVKRVLMEFLVICLVGTFVGLIIAGFGMQLVAASVELVAGNADNIPFWMSWSWRLDTVLAALLFALLLWLVSGTGPALSVARSDPGAILSGSAKGSMAAGNSRITKILVGAEVVFSFFLLTVCGAFIAGISEANNTDFGVETSGFSTASVELNGERYESADARFSYLYNLDQVLKYQGGVAKVAFTSALPSQNGAGTNFALEDRDLKVNGSYDSLGQVWVSDNYFSLMDVRLVDGRFFNQSDDSQSEPVVIVDNLFAQTMWPGENVIGKRVQINPETSNAEWLTIVGVTAHILQAPPIAGQRSDSSFYRPLKQDTPAVLKVIAKTADQAHRMERILQTASLDVDRDIPLSDIKSLDEIVKSSTSAFGVITSIFSWIAVVTVILAAIGIYGVIARSVVVRTQEIGIRMALGASASNIIGIFSKQGFLYIVVGLGVGGLLGLVTVYGLAQVIFGIQSMLPLILLSVAGIVGGLVMVASIIPAARVVRVEPGDALHYE